MRRLTVEGYDGGRPVALANVPAPLRGAGRAHSLAQVLEIALDRAGLALGYDAIMGLCGLAFRTPAWPEVPAPSVAEAGAAIAALSEALGDCMAVVSGEKAGAEALIESVAAAVEEGRPCIAFGWGSVKEHWSIIAGHDRGKSRLLGHCTLSGPRAQYESWPPALEVLVVLTDAPRPRGPAAVTAALQGGARRWLDEGERRYRAWIARMRSADDPPSAAHEEAVELLADARAAAASFAERVAARERDIAAAWLTRAAEQWREVVALLEARGVPYSPEAVEMLSTREGRREWAERLEEAAGHEERAAAAVRLSATADYPPEEAPPW